MEAFIGSEHSSLLPPPLRGKSQVNEDNLQQRLQALIVGARESWTYAVFWQLSYGGYGGEGTNTPLLNWGDGYYKGEEDKSRKKKSNLASAGEQEHRRRVIRALNAMISGGGGGSDEVGDEEVTDIEWFFLVSMTESFVNGTGLPGQSFSSLSTIWLSGSNALAGSNFKRARLGQIYGLQTMVCIPLENGVIELGSSEVIHQSSDLIDKVSTFFNFNNGGGGESGSWAFHNSTSNSDSRPISKFCNGSSVENPNPQIPKTCEMMNGGGFSGQSQFMEEDTNKKNSPALNNEEGMLSFTSVIPRPGDSNHSDLEASVAKEADSNRIVYQGNEGESRRMEEKSL